MKRRQMADSGGRLKRRIQKDFQKQNNKMDQDLRIGNEMRKTQDGHLRIPNEIAEKLARLQLSGSEHRIIWVVWRKTIGWQKKEDRISLSQLARSSEMKLRIVRRALASLVEKNIIIRRSGRDKNIPSNINILSFNMHFETWNTKDKNVLGQKSAQKQGQKSPTQQERKKKISIKVKQEYLDLVDLLITKMRLNDPLVKVPDTPTKREKWADSFRLLLENDKRPSQEVREILIWCQEDDFWRANILSAGKFRKQYQQLKLQYERHKKSSRLDAYDRSLLEMKKK